MNLTPGLVPAAVLLAFCCPSCGPASVAPPHSPDQSAVRTNPTIHDTLANRGFEHQRQADLGNGTYLNPIFPGDRPDPSILKEGNDYYVTHSSFDYYPGLLIWHSQDLVNWEPVGPALHKNIGSVWAPDLVKHKGRYFIYFPGVKSGEPTNYVVWADNIRGPWSEPIDLKIGRIDPGHAVAPDGKRYLFMSEGYIVPLADDGLSVTGPMKKVYEGWTIPDSWIVESFSLEGPKIVRRGEYYYMVVAEGGTAGPPTSHMVVAARSKTLEGPWEDAPHNPVVRTGRREDKWWSRGHGTLFEGPAGQWYLVYHGYENGFYTLGRQTLLEPVVWTDDGWFKSAGADVGRPIRKPAGAAVTNGLRFSDDFSSNKIGVQWTFFAPEELYAKRCRFEGQALVLKGKGESPKDSSPLCFVTGDQAYEMEVEIEVNGDARGGLILFYNEKLYAGLGFGKEQFITHRRGVDRPGAAVQGAGNHMWLRLLNDRNIVSMSYSLDGKQWTRLRTSMDVSGYHHNVGGGFLSLKPALYAAGNGEVRFREFKYRALP